MTTPGNTDKFHPDEPDQLTKARVEALKRQADRDAQQAKYYAEQARYQATQADKAEQDKEMASIRLKEAQMGLEQAKIRHGDALRREKGVLADEGFYGTFHFSKPIHDDIRSPFGTISGTVSPFIRKLEVYSRNNPEADIEITFNSPGGQVDAGFELFYFLEELKERGHYIATGTRSRAASMAAVLLQAGQHRWMSRSAQLLLHEGSGGAQGTPREVAEQLESWKKKRDSLVRILCDRSNGGITPKKLNKMWEGRNLWIGPKKALKLGLVDEIR